LGNMEDSSDATRGAAREFPERRATPSPRAKVRNEWGVMRERGGAGEPASEALARPAARRSRPPRPDVRCAARPALRAGVSRAPPAEAGAGGIP
jgi:hypothetical protein